MRTDDTTGRGRRFAQAEQKSVVDVGQTQAFSLTAAVVHKDLEGGDTEVAGIVRHAGKLGFGGDNEMIAKVDAGAGFGHGPDRLEDGLERFRGHEVGDEGGDATGGGSGRLL